MKQGNSRKKFGKIAYLMAVIGGLFSSSSTERVQAMETKNGLIMNYGGPEPKRVLNQRQKRKRYRQSHTCK